METPNHSGTCALLYHAAIAGLGVGLVAALMWASEPWQRPLRLLGVADEVWLLIAVLGFVIGVYAWPTRGRRRSGWRVVFGAAVCAVILIGFLDTRRAATVDALLDHDQVMKAITPGFFRPDPEPGWRQYVKDGFEHGILPVFGIGPPPSVVGGLETTKYPDAYDHLLETCRWPTRRAFVQKIIGDESRTRLATHDWHRLFPAVIGQDVTLAHRKELLDWLDGLASDATAPDVCRDAATFWMALVVLTDAEAFSDWSDRALSLMLAHQDPPLSLTGDVWMRALDLLIALTPREQHAELAEPLTRDAMLLRRALRQRVRGMEYHAAAIIREIESLDAQMDHNSAAAMWVDLKRIAKNSSDEEVAREIHVWLGVRLERWLMSESEVALEYFSDSEYYYNDRFSILLDGVMNNILSDDSKQRLAVRARAALDGVVSHPREDEMVFPDECAHALFIAALLDDEERIIIHNQAALILAKRIPQGLSSGRNAWSELSMISSALKMVMHDLHIETLESLKQTLIEWCVFHEKPNSFTLRFTETAVLLDMASEDPILSGAEQIAVGAFIKRYGGTVPQYSPEAVEEFIQMVISGEATIHMHGWFTAVVRRLDYAKSKAGDLPPDHIRYFAVLHGIIGLEHLPADLIPVLRAHGVREIYGLARDYADWRRLMDRPDLVRVIFSEIDMKEHGNLRVLIEHLVNHPPSPEIRQMILKLLERQVESPDRDVRLTAFHGLLSFSDWFDEEERVEFRKRFHRFFESERPSLDEWQRHYIHANVIPWGGLNMHRGEQVPWEDDALSVAFSWSSEIHQDLATLPWQVYDASSVFRHLHASGCLFIPPGWGEAELAPVSLGHIAPNRAFHDSFASPHLEVTPWQRARSLHLRRPDLKFPDRPIFRPLGKRVHLHNYRVMVDP